MYIMHYTMVLFLQGFLLKINGCLVIFYVGLMLCLFNSRMLEWYWQSVLCLLTGMAYVEKNIVIVNLFLSQDILCISFSTA